MAGYYQIRLKEPTGSLVAIIDDYRELSFDKIVNEIGSAVVFMNGYDPKTSLFMLDGQLEVYRRDVTLGIDWYLEWEGFIRDFTYALDADGDYTFTANGVSYMHLLQRHIVAYKAGVSQTIKSDYAETVMKEFVSENCGSDALIANGRIRDGDFTGFSVEPDGGLGAVWSGQRSYTIVLEVIKEIATSTGMDFDVVGIGDGLFEFRTYFPYLGTDRSNNGVNQSTGLNTAGNSPIIFNPLLGNVTDIEYSVARKDEVTVSLVAGQGQGEDRVIVVTEATTIADSPLNDIEFYGDARNTNNDDDLISQGEAVLAEKQFRETFVFTPLQTTEYAYGKNYYHGDFVTGQFLTLGSVDKRIMRVSISMKDGSETIELELGDVT